MSNKSNKTNNSTYDNNSYNNISNNIDDRENVFVSSACPDWDDFSIVIQYFCFSRRLSLQHTFCADLLQYVTHVP